MRGALAAFDIRFRKADAFGIHFDGAAGVGRVFDPDGTETAMASYPAGQTAAVEIKPKPAQTGQLWRLFMSLGNNSNHFSLNGVPPFVSGNPGGFFLPQLKPENGKDLARIFHAQGETHSRVL
ncbi:MAG: hypothetical protein HY360_21020 [Verrucomicrobia bacterium]|nr:hypothetical protein [Verrucomicrobiota bacterium]